MPEWARKWMECIKTVSEEAHASSDRACAVVMVAMVEDLLRALVEGYLPKSRVELATIVPMGSLGRLIDLAEALGVIHAKLATCLRKIAKVRNAFAHQAIDTASFESTKMKVMIRDLPLPLDLDPPPRYDTPRRKFMNTVGYCYLFLVMRFMKLDRLPVLTPEFDSMKIDVSAIVPRD